MFYSLLLAKCLVYGGCVSMEMTTLWLFLVCATRASQHSCEADHVSSDGVGTHADYTAQDYLDSNMVADGPLSSACPYAPTPSSSPRQGGGTSLSTEPTMGSGDVYVAARGRERNAGSLYRIGACACPYGLC